MTYIKEVELDNFKSFAGHTKFSFIKGFNIIAGANGSGKSNIIDAMMFVLGASSKKEMRSEVLTDLIFNGGKSQKPAEFAKVNIILDNSDKTFSTYEENEISISRKVDSGGKSVFRINGKSSTREEILNILSVIKVKQDSFNIIPQDKISEIAESSPEEQLAIINDLSGISIFEEKKSKAMNEMKKVQENISTIETVLKEKKKTMEQLENEKKRAEDFKKLKNDLETLQSKQVTIRKNQAYDALSKVVKAIKEIDEENKGMSIEKEKLLARLSEIRKEINEINTQAESAGERGISEAETKSKSLDIELSKLRLVLSTDIQQLERISESISEVNKSIQEFSESSTKENNEIKNLREKLGELTSKRHELTETTLKAEKYFKDKDDFERKANEINQKMSDYRLALANYPKSAELQSKLSELNNNRAKVETESRDMTLHYSEIKRAVEKAKANIKTESDKIYWLKENLLAQKALLASQNRAIETADRLKKDISGVYGTINGLFSIKDDRHSEAISSSIGRRGDFIVVEDEIVASKCIEKLKKDKLGSYNFIPLNKIVSFDHGDKPSMPFVIDYTINLIRFDNRFLNAMRFVFGDTLLVDSFDNAKSLINKYRIVTIDGTVFEKTGVISGGYKEHVSFSTINKKQKELSDGLEEHSKLKEKYEAEYTESEATLTFLLSKVKSYEKDLLDIKNNINSVTKELSNFQGSEADIIAVINKLEEEKTSLNKRISDIDSNKLERVDYKKDIEALDRQINEIQVKLGTATTRVDRIFKSEVDDLLRRTSALEKEKSRFDKDISEVRKKIGEDEKNLEASQADLNKKSEALVALRKRREDLLKESTLAEENLGKIGKSEREVYEKINRLRVDEAGLKAKFDMAEEEFKKYAIPDTVLEENESLESINRKLSSIKSKVDSFGPINELALETFNKILVEYNEGNEKSAKLTEERERILSVIKDIENKKLETFMKTLSDINSIFSSVFNSITNGKAELAPENPEDVFGAGLDIKVDLPNKKVHNIRGLSGGEKSILSIALLMSISKYIDVPFYVLDEVDAALDSMNSSKFSSLVKAYSETTEFIVITHNETTLLNADVIYGVTMTESGVSKVVSVKPPKETAKASS